MCPWKFGDGLRSQGLYKHDHRGWRVCITKNVFRGYLLRSIPRYNVQGQGSWFLGLAYNDADCKRDPKLESIDRGPQHRPLQAKLDPSCSYLAPNRLC